MGPWAMCPWAMGPWVMGSWVHGPWAHGLWAHGSWEGGSPVESEFGPRVWARLEQRLWNRSSPTDVKLNVCVLIRLKMRFAHAYCQLSTCKCERAKTLRRSSHRVAGRPRARFAPKCVSVGIHRETRIALSLARREKRQAIRNCLRRSCTLHGSTRYTCNAESTLARMRRIVSHHSAAPTRTHPTILRSIFLWRMSKDSICCAIRAHEGSPYKMVGVMTDWKNRRRGYIEHVYLKGHRDACGNTSTQSAYGGTIRPFSFLSSCLLFIDPNICGKPPRKELPQRYQRLLSATAPPAFQSLPLLTLRHSAEALLWPTLIVGFLSSSRVARQTMQQPRGHPHSGCLSASRLRQYEGPSLRL